ncbi:MAG TPA: hypothetical protein VGD56_14220 [Gemmatirosa sp.]
MNLLNFAVTQVILDRDRPNADPADVNRFSLLAAFVPGAAGLVVPFIAEQSIPEITPNPDPAPTPPKPAATGAGDGVAPARLTPGVMSATNGANDIDARLDRTIAKLDAQGAQVDGVERTLAAIQASLAELRGLVTAAATAGAGGGAANAVRGAPKPA